MKHPIQPLELDKHNVIRFKENAIVRYLLDNGGIDLNTIACMEFSNDDRTQFAQLIGYSHSGAADLSYFDTEAWNSAERMYEEGIPELEARNQELRGTLTMIRESLRDGVATLYEIHPDDLKGGEDD